MIKERIYTMLARAKNRAKSKGIKFEITEEDLVIPNYCPVLGIELIWTNKVIQPNSPSLDRLDPNKGYVKGNVNIISHRANIIKQNANGDEVLRVAKWLKRQERK